MKPPLEMSVEKWKWRVFGQFGGKTIPSYLVKSVIIKHSSYFDNTDPVCHLIYYAFNKLLNANYNFTIKTIEFDSNFHEFSK